MVPPVRVGVVIASDSIYSPAQVDQAVEMVREACWLFQQAAIRETALRGTAYGIDFDVRAHYSSKTLLQLQTNDDGTLQHDTSCMMPEGYYEGFSQNTVLRDVKAGLGWVDYEDPAMGGRNARWVVLVLQGGGVAGGTFQVDNWDGVSPWPAWSFGLVTLGDWGIYATVFGYGSHCCVVKYGTGFCQPTGVKALGALTHEVGHSFAMDTHDPYIEDGLSSWSDKQVADFIARNQQFIYALDASVPIPEPVPTPTPLPKLTGLRVAVETPIRVGQSVDVDVYGMWSDGTETLVNRQAYLSILDARIARVDQEASTLTGVRQGTTELIATYGAGTLALPGVSISVHTIISVKKRRWW